MRPSRVVPVTVRWALLEVSGSVSRELVIHLDRAKPTFDGSIVALDCPIFASHPLRAKYVVSSVALSGLRRPRDCRPLVILPLGLCRPHRKRALVVGFSRAFAVEPCRDGLARQTIVSTGPVRTKVRRERSACGPPEDLTDHHGESSSV